MRRVSSRRKSKSTAAHKRVKTEAQKQSVVASSGKRGPVSNFYVVGLGASAGGLEALRSFFAAVPSHSGAAFVIIQHLAPDHRSQMTELLATHTRAPVHQIEDGVMVRPDHVYVIPPGKCLKIFHGKLLLLDPEKSAPHLPIDQFFRSLAHQALVRTEHQHDGWRGLQPRHEGVDLRGLERNHPYATTLTIRCGTTITFFGGLPSSAR